MGQGVGRQGGSLRVILERLSASPTRPNDRAPEAVVRELCPTINTWPVA